ncbi:MAG: hypothetical protein UW41_C0005G0001, partial [Candidatus Collierbacteria bacterium GW2011_GWC2_44_18]
NRILSLNQILPECQATHPSLDACPPVEGDHFRTIFIRFYPLMRSTEMVHSPIRAATAWIATPAARWVRNDEDV